MATTMRFDESKIANFADVLRLAQEHANTLGDFSITIHTSVLQTVLASESRNSRFHVHTIEGTTWIKYDEQLPGGTMIRLFRVEDKSDGLVKIKEDTMSKDANLLRRMDR